MRLVLDNKNALLLLFHVYLVLVSTIRDPSLLNWKPEGSHTKPVAR